MAREETERSGGKQVTAIDDHVEALVREALAAVVGQDSERLQQAITAFPDGESVISGVRLAAGVALFALHDRHGSRRPSDEALGEIAAAAVEDEDWADITSDEIVKYLAAAYDKVSIDQVLPMERAIILAFVVAASLLSSYHRADEEWWDYLDRAESVIEATPEP
jgi:hypothetical protein